MRNVCSMSSCNWSTNVSCGNRSLSSPYAFVSSYVQTLDIDCSKVALTVLMQTFPLSHSGLEFPTLRLYAWPVSVVPGAPRHPLRSLTLRVASHNKVRPSCASLPPGLTWPHTESRTATGDSCDVLSTGTARESLNTPELQGAPAGAADC